MLYKKYTRKGKRAVKKPYIKKPSVKKIVKTMLKKHDEQLVEVKRINTTYNATDYSMGQVSGNAVGYFASDVTPPISTGTNISSRIGNEVKIKSLYMTLQFRQMSAATQPCKITMYLFRAKGFNQDAVSNIVESLWNSNNYIGTGTSTWDTGSDINIDQLGNYRILCKRNFYIKPDQFSGQQMVQSPTVGLKFKTPLNLRYTGTSATPVSQGRIMVVFFCNSGNASSITASNLINVPITATNTGIFLNYNIKWYFTDL